MKKGHLINLLQKYLRGGRIKEDPIILLQEYLKEGNIGYKVTFIWDVDDLIMEPTIYADNILELNKKITIALQIMERWWEHVPSYSPEIIIRVDENNIVKRRFKLCQ